jgi:hypothetical protein
MSGSGPPKPRHRVGAVGTLPLCCAPVAAGTEVLDLTTITTVPCITRATVRFCSTVAIDREVTTEPFAVCPPNQALAA